MDRRIATATLAAAVGLAAFASGSGARAQVKPEPGMERCYGIAARAKNDCAAGAHSCAGQSTVARDPKSFVYLPKGACSKIEGGKLSAA